MFYITLYYVRKTNSNTEYTRIVMNNIILEVQIKNSFPTTVLLVVKGTFWQ